MREKKNTIKGKIIGGFILALMAMLLTGIISYNSYKELLVSLDEPSNPEVKLKELSQTLADISEAEASMRAYALTRDDAFLDTYRDFASSAHLKFDSLKLIQPIDQHFNDRIDSISSLLDEKIKDLNSFLNLKRTITEVNVSLKALEEITSNTDSIPALRTTKTTTTTTTTLENIPRSTPVESAAEVEEKTKRRKRRRVQELAKQIAKLEMEPMIQTETKIITDTSFIQPDTVLGNVNRMLEEIITEESRYQRILAKKELDIIEGNILIIDQIRTLINNLEKEELALGISQANRAKVIASRSTLTVSIIIILCLITGFWLVYLIFKDISFRNFYNEQLIGAKNQAEQLAESKQQFLANMSHEIRTPLNAIIGFTEQLADTPLQKPQKKYLEAVQSSSQHLLETVNDILDYSKIEAGELKIAQEPFELTSTVKEVVAALDIKAQEKDLDLILEMQEDLSLFFLGDALRLKQILFNLVSNGIKFTDTGFVKINVQHTVPEENLVKISVQDSGIGMRPEIIEEIFKDFNQADLSATRKYEGTGLGLAICKKLVELQSGTIEVDSEPGHGSKFTVTLSYPTASPVKQDSLLIKKNQRFEPHARVLVVDDDSFNLGLLEVILKKWGLQVDLCNSGQQAKEQIHLRSYDLVLTDIHMPEVSGLDLCAYIRNQPDEPLKNIPIIALTANVMENDLEHYLASGINDNLLKPYREKDLFEKLEGYLSLSEPPNIEKPENGFSLDDFRKFSGDDESALLSILDSFHSNLSKNMEELRIHSTSQNWHLLAELAHKMISSFGHLHAQQAIQTLREMEVIARKGEHTDKVPEMVDEVTLLAYPIQEQLSEEIINLRQSILS